MRIASTLVLVLLIFLSVFSGVTKIVLMPEDAMMIMVALFDLFFRWIPYLFICLPIPGLKGKQS